MTLKDLIRHLDSATKWYVYDYQNSDIIWWGKGNKNSCPFKLEVVTISTINKGIKIYAKYC